jgi:dTDP-4-amino-4,6-dideoxygalactose transaminase
VPDRAVGGEFELGLSPDGLHRPEDVRRFWTSRLPGSNTMASTGRAALTLILAAVKREDRQRHTFLLPAYLCGSILEPFRGAGVRARFYAVDQNLWVDVNALVRAAHQGDVSGVFFINYFGLPADPELREALSGLRKRRWIIEDCAAGGMLETGGDPIGATGHFAFTSLRKFLPVPDGAVIWNRSAARLGTPPIEDDPRWVRLRALGKLLRGEHAAMVPETPLAETTERSFLALFQDSERLLDLTGGETGPSRYSLQLGPVDYTRCAVRRRRNFRALLEAFTLRGRRTAPIRPLFATLPRASSPLIFPVICRDRTQRDALRRYLGQRRVFCPVHWPLPADVDRAAHADAHRLSARILGLPVDFRYGPADMAACVDHIRAFARKGDS